MSNMTGSPTAQVLLYKLYQRKQFVSIMVQSPIKLSGDQYWWRSDNDDQSWNLWQETSRWSFLESSAWKYKNLRTHDIACCVSMVLLAANVAAMFLLFWVFLPLKYRCCREAIHHRRLSWTLNCYLVFVFVTSIQARLKGTTPNQSPI